MKRRVIGAVAAVLLAAVGALLLVSYVGGADNRAMAGMQTMTVLVVAKPIAQGAAGDQLGSSVQAKMLPAIAVTQGAVTNLTQLKGLVASTDLKTGEQVLASRFVDPATLAKTGEVAIPAGLQEVSFSLDPQRVLGGHVVAGARVGVFISLPKDDVGPAQTHLALTKVLVSRVDGGTTSTPIAGKSSSTGTSGTSTSAVTVTLAVSAADAETLVFGAENGTLWLSLETGNVKLKGTRVVTRENVDQ